MWDVRQLSTIGDKWGLRSTVKWLQLYLHTIERLFSGLEFKRLHETKYTGFKHLICSREWT